MMIGRRGEEQRKQSGGARIKPQGTGRPGYLEGLGVVPTPHLKARNEWVLGEASPKIKCC